MKLDMKRICVISAVILGCSPAPQTCASCTPGQSSSPDAGPAPLASAPAPVASPAGDLPSGARASVSNASITTPVTTHPRLLVRQGDLPRLRSWATPGNPIFAQGLDMLAKECAAKMDAGELAKDPGGATTYTGVPTEGFAELFAFMSLVSPGEAERQAYAKRARTLLMSAIDKAAEGVDDKKPFRAKNFSVNDRSRWHGEGFALTVDWIYGTLSAEDKAKIRKVFIRWADEITHAETTTDNHPEPVFAVNHPKLLTDRKRVRWAANNYYAGHARNLGLMVLAFDVGDDPGGGLRNYMASVTGAWLYVSDALMRGDMAGGLAAEGFEYSPQSVGYIALLLTAFATAGYADLAKFGRQVTYENPFWDAVLPGYVHSLSPATFAPPDPGYAYLAPLYSVAWYGDGDKSWASDAMGIFGPMAIYDQIVGGGKRGPAYRWIETNVPPGGAKELTSRARDGNQFTSPILYFMMFDPKAAAPQDPRPSLPLHHFSPGLGRILARTSWQTDASWFTYKLGWSTIDHQHTDGNMFELYRKGEWLIKQRTGYGIAVGCTDYKNGVAIENDPPSHNEGYRAITSRRGSQWLHTSDGDPTLVASVTPKYVYAEGDATPLYNSSYEKSSDTVHASRTILWLKPDRVFTYDRAVSKSPNKFKRYWLNFTTVAKVEGTLTTMTSEKGQKLYVRSLLPAAATITVEPAEPLVFDGNSEPAKLDPVKFRLRVEDNARPKSVRFLNVIQAADAGAAPDVATLVKSVTGTPYEGVVSGDVAVLFPVDLGTAAKITYSATAKVHIVTGLAPSKGYKVTQAAGSVTIEPGGDLQTDTGGVLVIGML